MTITNELFSWFKHESICPDVRALNSTISVHSTPNSIIGKEYCVWRLQMSFFSPFNHKFICPDVRALNATIFVHSTPNSIIDQGKCAWRSQMNFFSWFTNESICPNVRALNSTFSVHSTPNSNIGKKYYVWRLPVSYLADLSTSPYVLMLERWMLPFSFMQRPTVFLVRDIVYEDRKWVI